MLVTRISCATSATTSAAEVRAGGRAHRRARARTAPARPTCSRRSTSAAPRARAARRTSASWCGSAGGGHARGRSSSTADDGAHLHRGRLQPGEEKHLRVDGAPSSAAAVARGRSCACSCPSGSSSSRARPRPGARTSTSWSRRCGRPAEHAPRTRARSRSATRCVARIRAGAARARGARRMGRASSRATASRLMADRAEAVDGLRPPFTDLARTLGLPASAELRYLPRSHADDAEGLAARARRSAAPPTSSAASPPTARTATTSSCSSAAAAARARLAGPAARRLLALLFAERAPAGRAPRHARR